MSLDPAGKSACATERTAHDVRNGTPPAQDLDLYGDPGLLQCVRRFLPEARPAGIGAPVFPPGLHRGAVSTLGGAGRGAIDCLATVAHGPVELGGPELRVARDQRGLRGGGADWQGAAPRSDYGQALGRDRPHHGRCGPGERQRSFHRCPCGGTRRRLPMIWVLVAVMVGATTAGEVMQAAGMRRHGEIRDFRPGAIGRALAVLARNRFVIGGVSAMAISFFALMKLLSMTDLSFAVPVSAVTYAMETVLAKYLLKERVNGLRWTGAALVICGVILVSL